jgi:hypothetical protein
MNMLISTSDYIILWLIFLMYWSFLEVLIPSETYYVENIKSTNFILGQIFNLHFIYNFFFSQLKKEQESLIFIRPSWDGPYYVIG